MSVDNKHVTLLDHGDGDEPHINMAPNPTFASVLEARLGRRDLVKGTMGAAALGFLGTGLTGCLSSGSSSSSDPAPAPAPTPTPLLGFNAIPASESDEIVVPEGYSYHVLGAWGEPILGSMPAFSVFNTGADQAEQIGSHHDGMHFFPIEGEEPEEGSSEDGLLVINHEYVEPRFMHEDSIGQPLGSGTVRYFGPEESAFRTTDEVLKEMNAHGISIFRIRKQINNEWQIQQDSRNRRITALTPMEIQGPVRGSAFVRTLYSPNGTMTRGTLNNCAHGVTPWNTYMFSEENWAGYFVNGGSNPRETAQFGVRASGRGRYGWELAQSREDQYIRFDASIKAADATGDYRNEPRCFGWMVEVDPFDPNSVPKKRTALGRCAHEGVVFAPAVEGEQLVCYAGDDAQNQYIYKYVSRDNYFKSTANGGLLDNGILYVAKFNSDGSGEWLPLVFGQNGLTPANGYTSQADVLINTRDAATLVGATRMDRPEWGAVDPKNGDVYFTLTNNSSRTADQVDA
ncbi:MAG: PhoX family protein, partial [Pseudomonas sp.]